MEFALNFVRSNAGIDSPALLSSPFMLVSRPRRGAIKPLLTGDCHLPGALELRDLGA